MISIIPVSNRSLKKAFVDFPFHLYRHDKFWVPPLKLERHEFINPRKNPFFENAEVCLFLAIRENKVVGRISAQVNRLHNERYGEKTGHFGFFDCINDFDVAEHLLTAAESWLADRGMRAIAGPFSFGINEESGLLIEGFDSPPYPLMPHNFPYYQILLEKHGLKKLKDLFAWSYDATKPIPEPAQQIANAVREYPGLTVREVSRKHIKRDIEIISQVFNEAWEKNWGFVPWTKAELAKMVKDFSLILNPKIALIAEVNGEPAAISIAIPNYHEAIRDLKGKLFPFGLFKVLYRLKANKIKTARLALLGIRKAFRGSVLAGLSVYLYTEMHRRGTEIGLTGGELSWTLEDNEKINRGIEFMGGKQYKRYRVYGRTLG